MMYCTEKNGDTNVKEKNTDHGRKEIKETERKDCPKTSKVYIDVAETGFGKRREEHLLRRTEAKEGKEVKRGAKI